MRINDQEANRLLMLKTIRREEPVARTELTRLTGLASATVTEIVGDLVRRKIVLEVKGTSVGRGRPRVQLLLNPDAAYVLSAYMLPDTSLNVEISNLRGDALFGKVTPLGRAPTLEALVDKIAALLEEAIAASPFPKGAISSVGLSLPAVIDNIGGVLHWFQTYPIQAVAVGSIIQQRLNLPVTVDNNVNVMARAEHWFGEDRHVDDFSLFVVGMGLGFSQYLDGRLRTGAHGMNSEFGHIKVGLNEGPTCTCGAKGCLGMQASAYGVIQRVLASRGKPAARLADLGGLLATFAREAQAGDPIAREAFEFAGRLMGVAVANYINMTDPARVLVYVLHPEMADLIVASFYAGLQENTLPVFRGRTPVRFKVEPEARYTHGAAAIVLEQLYRKGGVQKDAEAAASPGPPVGDPPG